MKDPPTEKSSRDGTAHKAAICALLVTIALLLGFLESLIPLPVPGLRIGLGNLATLFALYFFSFSEAAAVSLTRCLLAMLLYGGAAQFPFSLGGALCALGCMLLTKRCGAFSEFGVGIAGAAAHNAAQICVAAILYATPAFLTYLAVLLPLSLLTGGVTALIYHLLVRALQPAFRAAGIKGNALIR